MKRLKGVVDILQDQKVKPPEFLYKYYPFGEWTPTIFQNNELYFQSPNCFNDPFDSFIRFVYEGSKQQRKRLFRQMQSRVDPNIPRRKALSFEKRFKDQHWDDAMTQDMKKRYEGIRERTGVCCMTEKKDNILMWSHYARFHTGFCLELRTDDLFFQNLHRVEYPPSDRVPCVNLLLPDWDELIVSLVKGLLTKAKEWEYEHEWRIIHLDCGNQSRQFRSKVLHGVILGCSIAPENKSRLVEWCKARQPRPVLYQSKQKETEFALDFVEMEY